LSYFSLSFAFSLPSKSKKDISLKSNPPSRSFEYTLQAKPTRVPPPSTMTFSNNKRTASTTTSSSEMSSTSAAPSGRPVDFDRYYFSQHHQQPSKALSSNGSRSLTSGSKSNTNKKKNLKSSSLLLHHDFPEEPRHDNLYSMMLYQNPSSLSSMPSFDPLIVSTTSNSPLSPTISTAVPSSRKKARMMSNFNSSSMDVAADALLPPTFHPVTTEYEHMSLRDILAVSDDFLDRERSTDPALQVLDVDPSEVDDDDDDDVHDVLDFDVVDDIGIDRHHHHFHPSPSHHHHHDDHHHHHHDGGGFAEYADAAYEQSLRAINANNKRLRAAHDELLFDDHEDHHHHHHHFDEAAASSQLLMPVTTSNATVPVPVTPPSTKSTTSSASTSKASSASGNNKPELSPAELKRREEEKVARQRQRTRRFRPYQAGQWSEKYVELKAYRESQGHCCVPHTYTENLALARWVKRQRYQYKLMEEGKPSTMTAERVKALEDLDFIWDSQRAAWEERLNELHDFRRKHGHCNVPSNFKDNPQLATWVKCQRRQYKLHFRGRPSNMTDRRVGQLESIGFEWELRGYVKRQSGTGTAATTSTPSSSDDDDDDVQVVDSVADVLVH